MACQYSVAAIDKGKKAVDTIQERLKLFRVEKEDEFKLQCEDNFTWLREIVTETYNALPTTYVFIYFLLRSLIPIVLISCPLP